MFEKKNAHLKQLRLTLGMFDSTYLIHLQFISKMIILAQIILIILDPVRRINIRKYSYKYTLNKKYSYYMRKFKNRSKKKKNQVRLKKLRSKLENFKRNKHILMVVRRALYKYI